MTQPAAAATHSSRQAAYAPRSGLGLRARHTRLHHATSIGEQGAGAWPLGSGHGAWPESRGWPTRGPRAAVAVPGMTRATGRCKIAPWLGLLRKQPRGDLRPGLLHGEARRAQQDGRGCVRAQARASRQLAACNCRARVWQRAPQRRALARVSARCVLVCVAKSRAGRRVAAGAHARRPGRAPIPVCARACPRSATTAGRGCRASSTVVGPGSSPPAATRRGKGGGATRARGDTGTGARRGYDNGAQGGRTPSLSGHPPSRSRNPLVAPLGGLSSASAAAATEGFLW